jgi:isoquinoline 1-oxidoreductase beta subunit
MKTTMHRRQFLLGSGALLSVSFLAGCGSFPVIPKRPSPDAQAGLSWITHESGRYTLTVPRVEMGQNILVALKQIACDELGVGLDAVIVNIHGTDTIGRVRATVGSESIMDFALPLAQACATLRDALLAGQETGELAAVAIPREQLRSLSGHGPNVGRSPILEQGQLIVTGQPVFASDVRIDGMLYGRVLRAPVSPELPSRLQGLDEAAARQVPGFVALVRSDLLRMNASEGIGILARTPGALDRIELALNAGWQVKGQERADVESIDLAIDVDQRMSLSARRDHYVNDDKVPEGAWDLDLRFDIPVAAHAPMEPRVAVANPLAGGGLEMWVGSQDVFYQRDVVCRRLGLSPEQVVVNGCRVGGAFGGKTICTVELEAAVLAREAKAPVKVQWTRGQEYIQAFHRPPSSHRVRVRLNGGQLAHWTHDFACSHILFTSAVLPAWLQKITDFIGDDGVARGSALPYRTQAKRIGFDLIRLPVHTGPWRGLGAGPNVFVIESVIDECAYTAGKSPIDFRMRHIEEPRLKRVLAQAVATAPPLKSPVGRKLRGSGVACGIYKNQSFAAVVADVEVDPDSGEVRVLHMHCAHDCGLVVNPDQVRAQCEGNMVWGLGMVLVESWSPAARQFSDSPIPRIGELPSLSVHCVDSAEPPSGAGETAIVAAGAAIANAIRAATGWRPTRLPLRPGDLQAGLKARA